MRRTLPSLDMACQVYFRKWLRNAPLKLYGSGCLIACVIFFVDFCRRLARVCVCVYVCLFINPFGTNGLTTAIFFLLDSPVLLALLNIGQPL